jgi:predicted DNA-binding transcriptional regulator AlpA
VQRSVSNLAKLRMTGDGPRFIKMGRLVGYDVADLDAWLDSLKRQRTGS